MLRALARAEVEDETVEDEAVDDHKTEDHLMFINITLVVFEN